MVSRFILYCILVGFLFSGCTSYESLVNFRKGSSVPSAPVDITNFKPFVIQPNDQLQIRISSIDATALRPFSMASGVDGPTGNLQADQYLVNADGEIEFPTVGKIMVAGQTIEEAKESIASTLKPYFEISPIIQMRRMNFKISVNGEVNQPSVMNIAGDRFTIVEAITNAGDFTKYSRRDSVMVVRERGGIRSFGYVDFNTPDVFSSPYYYLEQNDVVYVQPNKGVLNTIRDPATRALPWLSAIISLAAIAFTFTRL